MNLEHTFSVPIDPRAAFRFLEDIRKVAECMPGAAVDTIDDDGSFTGEVVVRVGPMEVAYRGRARWVEFDEERGIAVLEAKGREMRGNGTASANVTVRFRSSDDGATDVSVSTDLHITGRPAQFGRGTMHEVGNHVLSEFVECLRGEISANDSPSSGDRS